MIATRLRLFETLKYIHTSCRTVILCRQIGRMQWVMLACTSYVGLHIEGGRSIVLGIAVESIYSLFHVCALYMLVKYIHSVGTVTCKKCAVEETITCESYFASKRIKAMPPTGDFCICLQKPGQYPKSARCDRLMAFQEIKRKARSSITNRGPAQQTRQHSE